MLIENNRTQFSRVTEDLSGAPTKDSKPTETFDAAYLYGKCSLCRLLHKFACSFSCILYAGRALPQCILHEEVARILPVHGSRTEPACPHCCGGWRTSAMVRRSRLERLWQKCHSTCFDFALIALFLNML